MGCGLIRSKKLLKIVFDYLYADTANVMPLNKKKFR